jgi:hypothetical protein
MKTRPVEMELFDADGRTRRTERHDEAKSRSSQFGERAPETVFLHRINRLFFLLEANRVLWEVLT